MKKLTNLVLAVLILVASNVRADEGMWLVNLIGQYHMDKLYEKGFELSAEDIYSINNSSLKDAIIAIDHGMCTGEFVSSEGLFLTNHHCAYGEIQDNSTMERNLLEDGFWASSYEEEIPIKGKTISLLQKVEDVTDRVKAEVKKEIEAGRDNAFLMRRVFHNVEREMKKGTPYDVMVSSMFEGDKYYIFYYMTYEDVRMVGVPPSSIGYFGGETDNWMWPQHKGDFAMYRVYCGPDGKPAKYSPDNVPYQPKKHLEISLEGVQKGDFTMVMGYPYSTDRYLSSYGIEQLINISDPAVIDVREDKLSIMKKAMDADPEVQMKYADKYFNSSNVYKLTLGQNKYLQKYGVLDIKRNLEKQFKEWIQEDKERFSKYEGVLDSLKVGYERTSNYENTEKYFRETIIEGCDMLKFSLKGKGLETSLEKKGELSDSRIDYMKSGARSHFKEYNEEMDKELFKNAVRTYVNNVDKNHLPESLLETIESFDNDYDEFADYVYENSFFTDSVSFYEFLGNPSIEKLKEDPGFKVTYSTLEIIYNLRDKFDPKKEFIRDYQKLFVDGLLNMQNRETMYPDANSTMRVTYGEVGGYSPKDAVEYNYYTTSKGYLEKINPEDQEFKAKERFRKLLEAGDFGRYADEKGNLRIDFLTDTDITGGNSGSPVLNKNGELIGIAYDGNWESLTADYYFHPDFNKTICVDIRYVLFVIDKYANAQNIMDELVIKK